jgi:hypothetical protein
MSKNARDLFPPLFAQDIYSEVMSLRVHSDVIHSKHTVVDSRFQTYSYIRTCVLRKLSHGYNQLVLDVLILSETADMKPLGRNSEKSLCQNWTWIQRDATVCICSVLCARVQPSRACRLIVNDGAVFCARVCVCTSTWMYPFVYTPPRMFICMCKYTCVINTRLLCVNTCVHRCTYHEASIRRMRAALSCLKTCVRMHMEQSNTMSNKYVKISKMLAKCGCL